MHLQNATIMEYFNHIMITVTIPWQITVLNNAIYTTMNFMSPIFGLNNIKIVYNNCIIKQHMSYILFWWKTLKTEIFAPLLQQRHNDVSSNL